MASRAELAAQQAQLAKATRHRELSLRKNNTRTKARHAHIEQLIEKNRSPRRGIRRTKPLKLGQSSSVRVCSSASSSRSACCASNVSGERILRTSPWRPVEPTQHTSAAHRVHHPLGFG